ncbi:MAG: hypothetical protein ACSHW1_14630 [Yoonia sp.]|uniref:hypothetical protein n=1 Tax=Yoonia sp. TaxID=2212373 RepID=UPI003EF1501A
MARDKSDKTSPARPPKKTRFQLAVDEAEEMLRAATSPDYDLHRAYLKERGSLLLMQDPEGFIEKARVDPIVHDALRLILADFIAGKSMPPEIACDWLAAYLKGEAERPAGKAGRKKEITLHNAIWLTVSDLVYRDMQATRNDESRSPSACDAVAEAMQRLDLEPKTFDGIKRIWLRFQSLHEGRKSE